MCVDVRVDLPTHTTHRAHIFRKQRKRISAMMEGTGVRVGRMIATHARVFVGHAGGLRRCACVCIVTKGYLLCLDKQGQGFALQMEDANNSSPLVVATVVSCVSIASLIIDCLSVLSSLLLLLPSTCACASGCCWCGCCR